MDLKGTEYLMNICLKKGEVEEGLVGQYGEMCVKQTPMLLGHNYYSQYGVNGLLGLAQGNSLV